MTSAPKAMSRVQLVFFAVLLWAGLPAVLLGQSSDPCKRPALERAWNDPANPVRTDADELSQLLERHGFVVECVGRSKQEHLFGGQKGAAWYKTDHGVFEVLFLPRSETFAALEVIEHPQANGRYSYSFRGKPRIPTNMDSSKPIAFIKHGNMLFEVWGNKELAITIEKALQKS